MIFTPGIAVGAMSGSVGGITASRNRGGAYFRTRAIPVNPDTLFQQNIRGILSSQSQGWQSLTDTQRAAWRNWASQHPVTNALGASIELTGHQAYIQINSRIDYADGTLLDDPPVAAPPDGLESVTLTADIGTGNFEVAFTPTPLATDVSLWTLGAIVTSAGINYVTNLLRQIDISTAAAASPVDIETAFSDRFGTLQVGDIAHVRCATYDNTTGLLSTPLSSKDTIVST